MDYVKYREPFQRDGYVHVRGFLTSQELVELRKEIHRFVAEVAPALPDNQVFYADRADGGRDVRQIHRMHCDPFFEAYQSHVKWTALARDLLGEPVTCRSPIYFNKPPESDFPTPPHQDNCAFALNPPHGVEMLLAVDENFDEETGCLRYVPGSHREGLRKHTYSGVRGFALEIADFGPEDAAREVAVEMEPGDVLCHHPLMIHRAHRNTSPDRSRSGFSMWFRGESARIESGQTDAYDQNAHRAQEFGW
ncbi:phytanoyl-CoA dioxygenase family protein [Streptomyces avermitilis]|uniref:phytanoyl-CoA dioxygenase family protein n=1 Tax=Streptomyces avermitilis TaxID=33903 RepID=UPI0033B1E26F